MFNFTALGWGGLLFKTMNKRQISQTWTGPELLCFLTFLTSSTKARHTTWMNSPADVPKNLVEVHFNNKRKAVG